MLIQVLAIITWIGMPLVFHQVCIL